MILFVLAIAAAGALPLTLGIDATCAGDLATLNDDVSFLQVVLNLEVTPGLPTPTTHGSIASAQGTGMRPGTRPQGQITKRDQVNPQTSLLTKGPDLSKQIQEDFNKERAAGAAASLNVTSISSLESSLAFLDHCPRHAHSLTLIATIVALAVPVVAALLIFFMFPLDGDDLRRKFHAARIVPWSCLGVLGSLSIPVTLHRFWKEETPFRDIVTECVPTLPCFVIALFAALLLNDLVWIVGVFRTWRQKPLLLLHHLGYIIWVCLTLWGTVGYMNLVSMVIGVEELPELVASVSYLMKDSNHGRWLLLFTSAFRIMCSGYAIGCTVLFIALGDCKFELKAFLWFDVCLFTAFALQELSCLVSMTSKNMNNIDGEADKGLTHRNTKRLRSKEQLCEEPAVDDGGVSG